MRIDAVHIRDSHPLDNLFFFYIPLPGILKRAIPGAPFGTQLNFIRTCPCQAKDKIRLLTQKLEEGFVPPPDSAPKDFSGQN
jgi:hypothetical protein